MPDEIKSIRDKYFIVATSSMIDPYRLILKDGDIFGIFDRFGDILPLGKKEQGLYYGGTRFISHYELKVNGTRPLFLSSNIDEYNTLLTVDLTNPDVYSKDPGGRLLIRRDSIHIMRSRLLFGRRFFEHIRVKNFGHDKITFFLELAFDSDFKDIFEVRGIKRKKRGTISRPVYKGKEMKLAYKGLDGIKRTAFIKVTKTPESAANQTFTFKMTLRPGETETMYLNADCVTEGTPRDEIDFNRAEKKAKRKFKALVARSADIYTSNAQFNTSIKRSIADINMMLTETGHGPYPYGGIPWFCTPFGRDGIITALECLWINPELARGVLNYLSARQAKDMEPARAAQPGKILHEARSGEMAALNEVPFGLYYGSVDSTPLYIILAGAYWRRTGDTLLIRKLWPSIEAGISWLQDYGDIDGDGFLEYVPDEKGLRNQGWKDSQDSVFHEDGKLAEGAIALVEAQGYLYAAKTEAAALSRLMGDESMAERLTIEASELKKKFNKVFWDEKLGSYILALDGEKRPCRVAASNAGHALFTGIADEDKAGKVAEKLTGALSFSGWGIRTLSAKEARYNPMSYHNGSVWPHDNALIAYGMASYGLTKEFKMVFSGIFDASLFMEFQRLPELFCGFHRRNGVAPTLYPVACSPQTWASGSLIYMLQASLGIYFESKKGMLLFKQPVLPEFLSYVYINDLMVTPKRSVDILVSRYGEDVTVEALRKPDDVSILIIK
ncbi:MAG: amylo-alpha-1,6-glucosidase [Deltaproteobacteria bacterium]|nr:amylo-alpha-1,6-glucosidase [Deltaproteobacteria bacterium]